MTDTSRLVCVASFSTRQEAELARGALEASGIEALVASDDAGGELPGLEFTQGVGVFVREGDRASAEQALQVDYRDEATASGTASAGTVLPGTPAPGTVSPNTPAPATSAPGTSAPGTGFSAVDDLRSLAALTGTPDGAQRVAWGPVWRQAREWFASKVAELGLEVSTDSAGNNWVTIIGERDATVIVGGHLDSVPNGGWLDGSLGMIAGLEALRRYARSKPPVTLRLVDWADEEGARFGRSLLGSSAAGGTLVVDEVRHLKDKEGTRLEDALREYGVDLDRALDAHDELLRLSARAYLELHIEQGPVLESMDRPTGVVLGTFGVERHMLRFTGQAAHSGSTPIAMRRDAFLAAAETAIACRDIARQFSTPSAGVVCTAGVVKVEPGIVTAVPGVCEMSLDQRALDATVLAGMLAAAKKAAQAAADANNVSVEWRVLWRIEPRPFDPDLVRLCEEAVREVTGDAPRLPSGPLHDAAEMVPHMPVVMMFSSSSRGLSHCKEEDTPVEHLDLTIRAFQRLIDKTLAHVAAGD